MAKRKKRKKKKKNKKKKKKRKKKKTSGAVFLHLRTWNRSHHLPTLQLVQNGRFS
jgi:hypothetical protein